jgi:hypothetical protein
MLDEFLKRLPAEAKEERALVTAAFGIPGTVKEKADEIRGNTRLSEIGKQEKIKELAVGNPLAHLKQLRSRAAAMTADVQNLRKGLQPKAPDRADLFGEMQRQELRTFLRTLPDAKRLRLAMEDAAITEAVLHASPALSGLSQEQHELVKEAYVERAFGAQLRGIEKREEVISNVGSALTIATRQFLNESGLTEKEID